MTESKFVLGFMFSIDRQNILLMHKNRPDYQKGLLNGIGGRMLEKETPIDAMIREFKEETSVQTYVHEWDQYAIMNKPGVFKVYCFRAFNNKLWEAKTITDEAIKIFHMVVESEYMNNTVSGLTYLIPLALSSDNFENVEINYKKRKFPH